MHPSMTAIIRYKIFIEGRFCLVFFFYSYHRIGIKTWGPTVRDKTEVGMARGLFFSLLFPFFSSCYHRVNDLSPRLSSRRFTTNFLFYFPIYGLLVIRLYVRYDIRIFFILFSLSRAHDASIRKTYECIRHIRIRVWEMRGRGCYQLIAHT